MFGGYYYHMNKTFEEKQNWISRKQAKNKKKKKKKQKRCRKAILSELKKAVDLIGQEHIKHVKLIENKIVIVCEPDTNLDALIVRYGVMALIKRTLKWNSYSSWCKFYFKSKLNEKNSIFYNFDNCFFYGCSTSEPELEFENQKFNSKKSRT